MKKYINASNYYLSTIASKIEASWKTGTFDISDTSIDWVTLPLEGYYWVDVDFWDVSKREIFRIKSRNWYTLTYDDRISPYGMKVHAIWASVWLRDFSQLLNSLSTNTDNFWEVEKTWDLSIKVRWGKVMSTGNATMLYDVEDFTTSIPINSEIYIVLTYELSNDWILLAAFDDVDEASLTASWQYPIAKITTNATLITEIKDLRPNIIYGWGEWDMKASIYDPNNKKADVYAMDNMDQWTNNQYVSPAEKTYWWEKQDKLISWENISTINNISLLQWGNIVIDTLLTAWWAIEIIYPTPVEWDEEETVYTYIFQTIPLSSTAFIVMNNSGQILIEWDGWDYIYDSETHSITFPNWIPSTETYRAWIMYDDSEWWAIQYTNFLTQSQYDNLPDEQKTGWNVFMIYE